LDAQGDTSWMHKQSYYKGSLTFGLFDVTEIQFLGIARLPSRFKAMLVFLCASLSVFAWPLCGCVIAYRRHRI